jgi:hypothetical protein
MVAAAATESDAEAEDMAVKFVSLALLSVLSALLAYVATGSYGADNELPRILLALAFAVFFAIFLLSIMAEELSILLFVFALYHLFFFLLPGMIHLARNLFPFYDASFAYGTSLSVAGLVLLYSISSLLGILVGLSRRRPISGMEKSSKNAPNNKDFLLGSLLLVAMSVPCMAITGVYLERRGDFVSDLDPSPLDLILTSLPSSGLFLSAILAFHIMRRGSFFSIVYFVATAFLAFLVNYPLNLTRFILFERIIALAYLMADFSRARLKIFAAVFAIISIFTVFPTLDYFARGDVSNGLTIEPLRYIAESGDLDGLQSTLNVYEMVQSQGLSWGRQFAGVVLSYVPRNIWPQKPYSTGTSAAASAGYDFTNLSAPLISEIYVDFGMIGVAIVPFFLGWLIISLDRRAAVLGRDRGRLLEKLFYGGLIGYATILLRGSLISIISQIYLYAGLIGLLSVVCRPGRRRILARSRISAEKHAST